MKLRAALTEKTDAVEEDNCCWCCFICTCVNGIFNTAFEEVIDHVKDGIQTPEQYFESQENTLRWSTFFFRVLGVALHILGLYLIFTPIILLLKWIPLIGVFLGHFASFAALIIAFIVGLTVATFVMAMAWLFFRPLLSLTLIGLASLASYLVFNWDKVVTHASNISTVATQTV